LRLKTVSAQNEISIELNSSSFDDFIGELKPDVVLFDRFMVEEQYGWRVAENCPNAIRILDTEDLHFLRNARHLVIKENEIPTSALLSNTPHLYQTGRFDIECYPGEDQKNWIRRTATNIILLLNKKNPDNSELSNELSSWHDYDFKESREKHYDSFLSNSQVMPHGRIEGDAYFLVEELIDKGVQAALDLKTILCKTK
jgi:hypothetical protein